MLPVRLRLLRGALFMAAVFISYANEDSDTTAEIRAILAEFGISAFNYERDLPPGKIIDDQVRFAVSHASYVIVVLSQNSLASPWVWYEIGQAVALRKEILPYVVQSDGAKLEVPMFLSTRGRIESVDELRDYLRKHSQTMRDTVAGPGRILVANVLRIAEGQSKILTGKWVGQGHQQRGPGGYPINYDMTMDLRARGNAVDGRLVIDNLDVPGRTFHIVFDVEGGLVGNRFVWMNYTAKGDQVPHFGTFLFDLVKTPVDDEGRDALIGEYTGYGAISDSVISGYAALRKYRRCELPNRAGN